MAKHVNLVDQDHIIDRGGVGDNNIGGEYEP
jgi:hypothetical protein